MHSVYKKKKRLVVVIKKYELLIFNFKHLWVFTNATEIVKKKCYKPIFSKTDFENRGKEQLFNG